MNYDTVVKTLQTMLEIPLNQSDENFTRIMPRIIEYAENRIYRELDFLATTSLTTATVTADSREVVLPSTVLVLRFLSVIIPTPDPIPNTTRFRNANTRIMLERVSPEAMDVMWPQLDLPFPERSRVPKHYAIIGTPSLGPPQVLSYTVRMNPVPDFAYTAEFTGVIRPTPLSATNIETYLSTIYPDLFCAACMIFASGYQRDFGAMADDPGKAMTWETTYNNLRQGVMLEVARLKGEASGWSSLPPAPIAQPRAP